MVKQNSNGHHGRGSCCHGSIHQKDVVIFDVFGQAQVVKLYRNRSIDLLILPNKASVQINVKLFSYLHLFTIFLWNWGWSSIGRASDQHAADADSIPWCSKGFFSWSQLSVQSLLQCPYTPMCIRMHLHLCTLERSCSPYQSSVDYGNTKTTSMHHRLDSATLSQLAFPREGNPNFPREKSHWDNAVVNSTKILKVNFWPKSLCPFGQLHTSTSVFHINSRCETKEKFTSLTFTG